MPMTSPVDFISGPSTASTFWNFTNGNTASFTAMCGAWKVSSASHGSSDSPSIARIAIFASGAPIAFDTNGIVRDARGLADELDQIGVVVDDPHRAPAEHVRRPDEHRIADGDRDLPRFIERPRGRAGGLREPEIGDERIEPLAILGAIDRIRRRAE